MKIVRNVRIFALNETHTLHLLTRRLRGQCCRFVRPMLPPRVRPHCAGPNARCLRWCDVTGRTTPPYNGAHCAPIAPYSKTALVLRNRAPEHSFALFND